MSAPDRSPAPQDATMAWQAFVAAPARHVARRWLRACMGDLADDATLDALVRQPRFQGRLTQQLVDCHALPPPGTLSAPPVAEDALLLVLPANASAALVRYCGAIYHARDFVREIRAPRVVALKQRFGDAVFAAALANRALAVAGTPCDDIDTLERDVQRDGTACLLAWLNEQPAALAAWLRLGLAGEPGDAAPACPDIVRHGPAIVRCAAAIVATEVRESEHAQRATDTSGQGHPVQR